MHSVVSLKRSTQECPPTWWTKGSSRTPMVRGSTSMALKAGLILQAQAAGRGGGGGIQRPASPLSAVCLSVCPSVWLRLLGCTGEDALPEANSNRSWKRPGNQPPQSGSPASSAETNRLSSLGAPPTWPTLAPPPPAEKQPELSRGRGRMPTGEDWLQVHLHSGCLGTPQLPAKREATPK